MSVSVCVCLSVSLCVCVPLTISTYPSLSLFSTTPRTFDLNSAAAQNFSVIMQALMAGRDRRTRTLTAADADAELEQRVALAVRIHDQVHKPLQTYSGGERRDVN